MKKQMTLSVFADELAQASTKKKEFLAQIDRIIPWSGLIRFVAAAKLSTQACRFLDICGIAPLVSQLRGVALEQ